MLPHSVTLPPDLAESLGLPGTLWVGRVWPRRPDRLALELQGEGDTLLAGQWFADAADRDRIVAATRSRAKRPDDATLNRSHDAHGRDVGLVLVQAHGADRRLRALPEVLAAAGTTLVAHRPERRAVAHRMTSGGGGGEYLRIVRPGRSGPLVRAAADASYVLADLPDITTPTMHTPTDDGVVVSNALPGRSLREVGAFDLSGALAGAAGLGRLLRHLGTVEPPHGLPPRDHRAEISWVGTWLGRVADHLPHLHPLLEPKLSRVAAHLHATVPSPPAAIHGDLHDAQVVITGDHVMGILDWDTMAIGEVALDAGNIWAHADLRHLLGHWPAAHAQAVWHTAVSEWRPDPVELARTDAYRRLILLRLACQYAFRPAHRHVVERLAARASEDLT